MQPRLASLDGSIRTFALWGASAHAPENTATAFALALEMGASGIATEAWLTADGEVVLSRTGSVGGRFRRRAIAQQERVALGPGICGIDELYRIVGPGADVSIDVGDTGAVDGVIATARQAGDRAESRLWLCHADLTTLAEWRRRTEANLVLSISLRSLRNQSPEQCAARLRERGVDGLRLDRSEWSGGLIALVHRFDRYALASGLVHEREIAKLVDGGIDGISCPYVDRMAATVEQYYT